MGSCKTPRTFFFCLMRLALKSWSGAVTFLKTGFLADFWSLESFAARAPFLNFKTSAMTKRNLIDLMSSITKSDFSLP